MCGILFHRFSSRPKPRPVYDRALALMAERGPDHQEMVFGEGVALGHTRLAIIDPDAEANQPFWDEERRRVIVFNGEIYNYRSLRRDMETTGVRFATASDTEVLLKAIVTYGIREALAKIRGMFAFALHDARTGRTIVARDHFGQKPLYYSQKGDEIIVASDPLAVSGIKGEYQPDLDAYGLYLATLGDTGTRGLHVPDRSFFRHVKILPAGHFFEDKPGRGIEITRYFAPWDMFDPDRYEKIARTPEDGLVEELSHLVRQSVRRHLVSDVPSGALLSGGIDSSCVFWYAVEQNPDIQTFTKISPGIEHIPLDVVPELLRRRPATAHFVKQEKHGFVQELEKFILYSRAPSRWNSGPSMNSLSQCARDNGVITLLGGDCVDEYFGGYIHYKHYFERRPPVEDLGDLVDLAGASGETAETYLAGQRKNRREILDRLGPVVPGDELLAHATMLQDTGTFLQTCTLPHSDAYSMMASVELRNPMLDLDLVSFAVNLPANLRAASHANGEFGKLLFRKLAAREIGEFTNIKKEGTRNYAMSMADAAFWRLERFAVAELFALPKHPSPRELIRIINLELFHNAFFAAEHRKTLNELMSTEGQIALNASRPRGVSRPI